MKTALALVAVTFALLAATVMVTTSHSTPRPVAKLKLLGTQQVTADSVR